VIGKNKSGKSSYIESVVKLLTEKSLTPIENLEKQFFL
jgi:molybdopterin-guanine dinucleotide biosynthesis protein